MQTTPLYDLLLQTLEQERSGVKVYETALECAHDDALHDELARYLEETKHHVEVMEALCAELHLDAEAESPERALVRESGAALVQTMKDAIADGDPEAAESVACECVVETERTDRLDRLYALL